MKSPLLLDASAIMELLRREAGAEVVTAALAQRVCKVSSVTLTELEGKLRVTQFCGSSADSVQRISSRATRAGEAC